MQITEAFTGKTLVITGGTGRFGSTVLKHFLTTDIGEILIISRDERKQDWMRHALQAQYPEYCSKVQFYVGNVHKLDSVRDIMYGADFVAFAFELVETGDLYVQKADVSTIEDLAESVMKAFGESEKKIIASRHGEELYETLITREETCRSVDMGHYYRIVPDDQSLNYDTFYVKGTVHIESEEAYTSHNTNRLDYDGVAKKIVGTDYVKVELEGRPHAVAA